MPEDVLLTDYRKTGISTDALTWGHEASVYHPPTSDAVAAHTRVNKVCEVMLHEILEHCPPSRDRTIALNKVREARMWANSSIATEGKL